MAEALVPEPIAALRAAGAEGYLVGGSVRDRLLGRTTSDYDVVVPGDAAALARAVARAARGHAFRLSEGFGVWRVVARERWQLDLLPIHGEGIVADLAARDLTVNAIAEPLAGGDLVDPFGGCHDLAAGRLRMVAADAFATDPLRVLRLVRLAGELGFAVEPQTAAAAARNAGALAGVAAERVFAELRQIIAGERAVAGLERMDAFGVTAAVLPELTALEGVEQNVYHHLDVHGHTRAVLAEAMAVELAPAAVFGAAGAELDAVLAQPFADELTGWTALRFGALFHDVAKPQTRAVNDEGRTTFMGHDVTGAEVARAVLTRLRASSRLADHVAALVRHHLRLGFLVHQAPLDRRAVYGYLRACEPVEVDVTVLSVADRLATRGRGAEPAIARHVELAREVMPAALRWRQAHPRPPLRGDELVSELGLRPGPALGVILRELEQAAYAGELTTREEALAHARRLAEDGDAVDR
jgi:putative nucleotidyltransferase with HDIG domain